MNLYKISTIFLLSLFLVSTSQHVCTDSLTTPIVVKRTIGQGSQGKAEEVIMNRKQLVLKTFLNTGQVASNLNEALMHKLLSNADIEKKNVVTYHLCFKKDGNYEMLMEYFSSNWENSYFKSIIKEKSEKERAQIYKSLIEKVQFMHQQGFLHCDIKPDNIFSNIQDITDFKLGDFGLSKYIKNQTQDYKCSAGSAGYVAPEISKSKINPNDSGIMIAQIETNNSCNVLNQSTNIQEAYFQQDQYNRFLQYITDCLPQSNDKQTLINNLIQGLLLKDESQRLDEEQSYQILNQIIYDLPSTSNQKYGNRNQALQNQQFLKPQRQKSNPYGQNQPIRPIHGMNILQNNAQINILPKQQNKDDFYNQNKRLQQDIKSQNQNQIDLDQNAYKQKHKVIQNNFFNMKNNQQINQKQSDGQKRQRNQSYDIFNRQVNQLQRPQQIPNQQRRGISNQQANRQEILARRNQSNDIWGLLQNNNKFLI